MRILLLANNWLGLKICEYLKQKNETIVGVALHEKDKQRYVQEILKVLNLPKSQIFEGIKFRDPQYLLKIKKTKPDVVILCGWAYILKPEFINIPPKGVINMHPGFLPYNRGMNPNVWPIIEETPAGSTIHYVEPGIDDGPIIAQTQISIESIDTGGTLYDKTIYEMVELFKKSWPSIKNGKIKSKSQNIKKITFHYARDIEKIDKIDLNKRYRARDLLNIIRARTYQDRTYAYFMDRQKKVYVSIRLSYANDLHDFTIDKEEGFIKFKRHKLS